MVLVLALVEEYVRCHQQLWLSWKSVCHVYGSLQRCMYVIQSIAYAPYAIVEPLVLLARTASR